MNKLPSRSLFLALVLICLFLFRDSFSMAFFQDDFFFLKISGIHSFADWLRFFIPRSDVQFYRPISSELFYLINKTVFGFQPFWFHVSAWSVWVGAVLLVYLNTGWFALSRPVRLLITILYATSAIHYNSLFWIANVSYVFSAFFYFLLFYGWKRQLSPNKEVLILPVLYLLGLWCSEFLLTLPFLLLADGVLFSPDRFRRSWKTLVGLGCITMVYLIVRLFIFKPNVGTYHFVVNASVISSYRWFLLFCLNWPETVKDYFLNIYTLRSDFRRTFPLQVSLWLANSLIVASICMIDVKRRARFISRELLFGALWFGLTLTPIIFVPSHVSPHQGSVALFGLLLALGVMVQSGRSVIPRWVQGSYLYGLLLVWMVSASLTVQFNNRVHWIYRRSEIAKHWLADVQKRYPSPKPYSTVVVPDNEKEVQVALNDGEAIRQLFSDPTLKVEFSPAR